MGVVGGYRRQQRFVAPGTWSRERVLAALCDWAREFGHADLAAHDYDETPERTNDRDDIAQLRDELQAAIRAATPIRLKPLLHPLIHEIRVDSRQSIEPTFQIPAVRIDDIIYGANRSQLEPDCAAASRAHDAVAELLRLKSCRRLFLSGSCATRSAM
ncbi:MAG: hypothetical protein ACYCX7_10380, partial [Solirubrobacteraceae bacterium]